MDCWLPAPLGAAALDYGWFICVYIYIYIQINSDDDDDDDDDDDNHNDNNNDSNNDKVRVLRPEAGAGQAVRAVLHAPVPEHGFDENIY